MTNTSRSPRNLPLTLCAAAALTIALLASACGVASAPAGTEPSAQKPRDASLNEPPTPPSMTGVTPPVKEPARLAEMVEPTQDGAIATAVYFVSLLPYIYLTGDASAFGSLSAPDCGSCTNAAQAMVNLAADGPQMPATAWNVTVDWAEGPGPASPTTRVTLTSERMDTKPAALDSNAAKWILELEPSGHGWLVHDIAVG